MSHKKEVWHLGKYGALIIRVWHQQKYLSLQNEIWFWERSNQISKLLGHWPSLGVSVLSDQVATDHGENGSSLLQIMMLCFLSHDRLQFRVILSIISNTFNLYLYLASPSSTPVICLGWLIIYSDLNICSISCIKNQGLDILQGKCMFLFFECSIFLLVFLLPDQSWFKYHLINVSEIFGRVQVLHSGSFPFKKIIMGLHEWTRFLQLLLNLAKRELRNRFCF